MHSLIVSSNFEMQALSLVIIKGRQLKGNLPKVTLLLHDD